MSGIDIHKGNNGLHTVMVIDDDELLREVMAETLQEDGYTVVVASNGQEALDVFKHSPVDLILCDVMMPVMNGYDFCENLRQLPNGRNMPVIIMTGQDDIEAIEKAFDCGATDFISKPVNWPVIGHRIQYTLRASQAIKEATLNAKLLSEAQRIAKLGNWSWDTDTKEMLVSAATYHIFRVPRTSPCVFYQMLLKSIHPDDRAAFDLAVEQAQRDCPSDIEFTATLPNGTARDIHMHAERIPDGTTTQLFGTFQDITERKNAEAEIRQLAYYDAITGLPNRTLFKEHLQQALQQAQRNGTRIAVMFLDLDNFKRINDSLGHKAGDQLLAEISSRLQQCIRGTDVATKDIQGSSDSLARLGGDEFTLMLTDIKDLHHVSTVAERVLKSLSEPIMLVGNRVVVTSSIGVSIYPDDGNEIDSLLKHADAAMYQVKYKGRNGVFFYDDELRQQSQNRLQLESELYKALKNDEMTLFYQPKINANTLKVEGFEALIRWIHPEKGMVSPADFIPVAEDSGLIIPMGKWVIKTACQQLQAWRQAGAEPITMAVNLSCHQFSDHQLLEAVEQIINETGVESELLEFEITESVLMQDAETAMRVLNEMKQMGMKLSVDDFGTGYSSMAYLKHFPLDVLKIDRSFVMDIPQDKQDITITTAIISLAKALELNVVAEGVETTEQLEFLRSCECDQIQGFLFSPPVPSEKAGPMIYKPFSV
ncbi:cyclic di-GMP phosphodiesterase Gmr [Mariprofundus micogutta]|uniref:Cyclic di-GMP phosphodiesterase Gmr n=1 Tax=Mariprofundus micogutta TaxID=1921010 RepID=A0A1L8CM28_9PROT|nr:EAL domain-containing protein [Mariprofundus micogutta]GAV19967.1 cyclic di-GMP phosphodiesterase Gmr [Mariprofundus micogutta]